MMKTLFQNLRLLLVISLISFTFGCQTEQESQTETETETEVETTEEEVTEINEEEPATNLPELSANDHYQNLFNEAACDKIDPQEVAPLLGVSAAELTKTFRTHSNAVTCQWGYFPDDKMNAVTILATLKSNSEPATSNLYERDQKELEKGSQGASLIDLEVPHEVTAIYKNAANRMHIYTSNDSNIQLQFGYNVPNTAVNRDEIKDKLIAFAELYLNAE